VQHQILQRAAVKQQERLSSVPLTFFGIVEGVHVVSKRLSAGQLPAKEHIRVIVGRQHQHGRSSLDQIASILQPVRQPL
jgi:hypothetical protein